MICASPDCSNEFSSTNKNAKYCSVICANRSINGNRRTVTPLKAQLCLQCEKEFIPCRTARKFCGKSCSATYSNLKLRGVPSRKCVGYKCDKFIPAHRKEYCSNECKKTTKIQKWLEGDVASSAWGHPPAEIRRYLLDECGNACSLCGWSEVNPTTGRVPLELDHIDGNCRNNTRVNLRILCPNCHSLTPTFRALNKGRGRQRKKDVIQ